MIVESPFFRHSTSTKNIDAWVDTIAEHRAQLDKAESEE